MDPYRTSGRPLPRLRRLACASLMALSVAATGAVVCGAGTVGCGNTGSLPPGFPKDIATLTQIILTDIGTGKSLDVILSDCAPASLSLVMDIIQMFSHSSLAQEHPELVPHMNSLIQEGLKRLQAQGGRL